MTNGTVQYAGFWRRWGAYMIDIVIVGYFAIPFYEFFRGQLMASLLVGTSEAMEAMEGIARVYHGIFVFFLTFAYCAGMESSPIRATVGKLAVGIFVTGENGEPISFGQASGRFFGKIISSLILYIGFMMAGWTSRKQALHDILAGTLVLRK